MRRVLTHRITAGASSTRPLQSRSFLAFRMPSSAQNSKIATRRLHATAQQLKPAVAAAATTSYTPSTTEEYPTSHAKIQDVKDTPYFRDNQFLQSETTHFIELHDPATNNLVTRVPQSTDAELKAAVESAKKAFPAWAATSVMARQQIMFKFTQLIRENWDRLAASITLEQGKTFAGKELSDTTLGHTLISCRCQGRCPSWFTSSRRCLCHSTTNGWRSIRGCQGYGDESI